MRAEFPIDPNIALVPLSSRSDLIEIGRTLAAFGSRFPDTHIIAFTIEKVKFKTPDVTAMGISEFYRLPFEEEIFINKMFEISPIEAETRELTFDKIMRVNIVEIENAEILPFNVYLFLPMNRRAILYIEKGKLIDDRMLQKFRDNSHYGLYIQRSNLRDYLKYSNEVLAMGDARADALSRARKTGEQLAGLMGGYFTDDSLRTDESRMMLENLKSVVNRLGDTDASRKDLARAVSQFTSAQMTHISHAQNVAAYCCLFGLALGIGDAETLRLGGLMHDIGLSQLPSNLMGRDLSEMQPLEAERYKEHPADGKQVVESRGLPIDDGVLDMILYHHERPDGSGYPFGLSGSDIPELAKICAFADEFDKLTSVRRGKKQLSPPEAIRRIAGLDGEPPLSVYEARFHGPLVHMFLDRPRQTKPAIDEQRVGPQRNVGKVKVTEAAPLAVSSRIVTLRDLMGNPRYFARDDRNFAEIDPGGQVLLQDLRAQLRAHWSSRKS